MKTFTITATDNNLNWVEENLDRRDYVVLSNEIVINYFNETQKIDILNAINSLK